MLKIEDLLIYWRHHRISYHHRISKRACKKWSDTHLVWAPILLTFKHLNIWPTGTRP